MNFAEYQQLAGLLNEARRLLYSETILGPKKSTKYRHFMKSVQYIDKLRAECEELMFIDCPEEMPPEPSRTSRNITAAESIMAEEEGSTGRIRFFQEMFRHGFGEEETIQTLANRPGWIISLLSVSNTPGSKPLPPTIEEDTQP